MNTLILILVLVLLFGSGGYVGLNHGWQNGAGVSVVGLIVAIIVMRFFGII